MDHKKRFSSPGRDAWIHSYTHNSIVSLHPTAKEAGKCGLAIRARWEHRCEPEPSCPYSFIRSKVKWSRSLMSDSLRPHGMQPTRLLYPWNFPGKSTRVGCHFLLQGILLTQGLIPGLPHCKQMLYHLSHQGSPKSDFKNRLWNSNKYFSKMSAFIPIPSHNYFFPCFLHSPKLCHRDPCAPGDVI